MKPLSRQKTGSRRVETPGQLLRFGAGQWWRGPASLRDGWIDLDWSQLTPYDPSEIEGLATELWRVQTAEQAVSFVGQFGPLYFGVRHDDGEFERLTYAGIAEQFGEATARPPVNDSELLGKWRGYGGVEVVRQRLGSLPRGDTLIGASFPLAEMLQKAAEMREIVGDAVALQKYAKGDTSRVLERVSARNQRSRKKVEEAAFTKELANSVGRRIERKLEASTIRLAPSRSRTGHFRFQISRSDLLEFCYFDLARILSAHEELSECPGCGSLLRVKDDRQKYCSGACSNRHRQRRFQEKRSQSAK